MNPWVAPVADLRSDVYANDPTHGLVQFIVERILGPLAVFIVIWLVGHLVRRLSGRALGRAGADAQVRTLVHNVITVGTVVLALLGAMTNYGLPINVLLTFGGLFSLAIGIALQDLLRNVLAGIFLLLERPFRIGDFITVGDQTGIVQTIRLRTTELKTPDGRKAILPNLAAFTNPVINSSAFKTRQFELRLWVAAGSDIDRAVVITRRELLATRQLLTDPPAVIMPIVDLDLGHTILAITYWLDYRRHDPDAVHADLARRLRVAVEVTPEPAN